MTFTFDPTDDIGKVRRLTGETVEAESETSDEEITAWLADYPAAFELVAVKILRSLAAKWAKRSTITTGNEKIELGKVSDSYRAMADDLETSLGLNLTLKNTGVNRVHDRNRYRRPLDYYGTYRR